MDKSSTLVLVGLAISLFLALLTHEQPYTLAYEDVPMGVRCGSDSMGLILSCGDTLLTEPMLSIDKLRVGQIYVYAKQGNSSSLIVHRLIACLDKTCDRLLFKGDNVAVADAVVMRSDVLYHVVGVKYVN